jgi:hypothetical protein
MINDALDLINRKDAVIFNLNKENSALKLKNDEFLKSNEKAKAEIESLKEALKDLKREMSYMTNPNIIGNRNEMGCW